MKRSDCVMVCAQKEMSREVSLRETPTFDLNHCRSSSTRLMRAMGASQIRAASSVRSSKISSGTVSSTSYCQSTLRRFFSFLGIGARMVIFAFAETMIGTAIAKAMIEFHKQVSAGCGNEWKQTNGKEHQRRERNYDQSWRSVLFPPNRSISVKARC